MGNIITGLFWMRLADRTNDARIISFTMKGIIRSDRLFTIPGVLTILAGGFGAAIHGGLPLLRTGWIFWSIVLFTISGIIFTVKLAPLQQQIQTITAPGDRGFDAALYKLKLKQWERWGLLAMLTPAIAMVMMVIKLPALSGLF